MLHSLCVSLEAHAQPTSGHIDEPRRRGDIPAPEHRRSRDSGRPRPAGLSLAHSALEDSHLQLTDTVHIARLLWHDELHIGAVRWARLDVGLPMQRERLQLVLVRERDGKRYLYSPKLTREEFMESTAREVLDEAVGGHQAMAMLA